MDKLRNDKNGFGAVEGLLIVVIVVLIGVIGGLVYKNHNKTTTHDSTTKTSATSTAKSTTPSIASTAQPASETDKWYLYSSSGGEYKVRLADGLTFIGSNDSPSIYTLEPITLGTTPAKVVIQNSGGESDHGLYINYFAKSADANAAGDKQTGFKTNAGLDVEKYYYYQATEPQGLGLSKGGKEYTYRIIKDGKALTITYDITASGTVNTSLVEEMIKTVQL